MSTTKVLECESCGHPIGRGRLSCQNCGAAATARAGRVTPEWEKTEKAKKCLRSGGQEGHCTRQFHNRFKRLTHFAVRTAGAFVNQVSVEYPFVDIIQFYKRAFGSDEYYGYVDSKSPEEGLSLSYVKTNGLHRLLIVQHGSMELSIFETSDEYLEAIEAVIERADKIDRERRQREWQEKAQKNDQMLEAAQAKYGEEKAAYAKLPWWKKRLTKPPKLVIG